MHLQPSVAPPSPVGARIARPFISDVIITFRAGARRVIGATAKPLYPIDGKAEGIDRRNLSDLPPRGRGTAAAVEGVRTHCFYAEYLFLSTYRTYEAYEAYEAQEPIFGKTADFDGGWNCNCEMRLQRWVASLQRLDAFATVGCTAVPRRGAHRAPVYLRCYNNLSSGRAKGYRGDRKAPISNRRQGRRH